MTIKKSTIIFFVLIFPFFEPTLFEYRGGIIDYVFLAWKFCSVFYIVLSYIKEINKSGISNVMIGIIVYQFVRILINIYHGISIIEVLKNVYIIIGFSCLIDLYIKKDVKMMVRVLYLVFIVLLIINYFSYNFNILTYSSNIYFLGMRTRFTDMAYCLIVLSFFEYYFTKNKVSLVLANILGIVNILMASVTTGIVGILIFYIILIFLNFTKKKYVNWYVPLLSSSIIFNILIVFYRIQEKFAYIIEQIFHKNLTFTGRTLIWDSAIEKIGDSKLLGHGFHNNGEFAYFRGIIWQAHNQILQIFYETGYVGLLSFLYIFLSISKKLKLYKNEFNTKVVIAGILGISVMMISEILSIYVYFYLLIIIADNINMMTRGDESEVSN